MEANTANYMDRKDPSIRTAKKELLKGAYTSTKRNFEILFVVIWAILIPFVFVNIFSYFSLSNFGTIFAGLMAGWIFADFMSGLVHWGADTWGSLEVPFFGQTFIRSFREHHLAPTAMCHHDLFEANGDTVMLTIPVLVYWVLFKDMLAGSTDGVSPTNATLFNASFWLFAAIGIAFTNQFHKWAHMSKPPKVVSLLQDWWIILPRRMHSKHHQPPFDSNYTITNGWLNPLLSLIGFWRRLESFITLTSGWVAREDDYKWTGLAEGLPDAVQRFLDEKKEKSSAKSKGVKAE
eukprot:TRINITY_DN9634_c0_g1_i1.p1 TRINITY_DN9634_c0_g1~~TRINITY_DN9634_c0_g1_i1.p1  ORF type:complete len:292 (-),score=62.89 TRINITY_DN9634_c0_g1_i1:145-1020(-)